MIFLIQYNRARGEMVRLSEFAQHQRAVAAKERLALELELFTLGIQDEVVTLEADSLDALRETHGRYFDTLESLARRVFATLRVALDR